MKLEDYLKGIRECRDDQLQSEYSICDNYTILIKAEMYRLLPYFMEAGKYLFEKTEAFQGLLFWRFNYLPGTVNLQLFEGIFPNFYPGSHEEKRRYHEYSATLVMHHYQKNRMGNVFPLRAIALVLEDLCTFFRENEFPFCFPKSSGAKKDISRILFHPENNLSFS